MKAISRNFPGGGIKPTLPLRRGFTLVEVIVVLVILAILAAIAIPALTGYIAKAQEKQYIAEARNAAVAMKTVLTEAYGSGEISDAPAPFTTEEEDFSSTLDYFTKGLTINDDTVEFDPYHSQPSSDSDQYYESQAAQLIGEPYSVNDSEATDMRFWKYLAYTATDSGATMTSADGFMYILLPEGIAYGKPVVCVTYKIAKVEKVEDDIWTTVTTEREKFHYDPTAGYEVYQATILEPPAED
jgi:prepilin-type N-terminal cleavage/methylation domain-containing protein